MKQKQQRIMISRSCALSSRKIRTIRNLKFDKGRSRQCKLLLMTDREDVKMETTVRELGTKGSIIVSPV